MNKLNFEEKFHLTSPEEKELLELWNDEYPKSINYTLADFQTYLKNLENLTHYFLRDLNGKLILWTFTFIRNKEVFFAILIQKEYQCKKIGSKTLDFLKSKNEILNGWVIDSSLYKKADETNYISPLDFYLKNDFKKGVEKLQIPAFSAVKITWRKLF